MKALDEIVDQLPPEKQQEVFEFAQGLLDKKEKGKSQGKRYLTLTKTNWRGVLREWRDEYTSVELQHKILDLWGH